MFSDENISRYAKALYPVAILLVLVPLVDLSLRAFPPQPGSLQWRFASIGLLLGNFGTILLGFGLLGFAAVLRGSHGVLRIIGYVALVLGALTIAIIALFALDAIQMRTLATANYKRAILLSAGGAMFAGIFGIWTLFAIGRGALAASKSGLTAANRRVRPTAAPLVVAGQGAGES